MKIHITESTIENLETVLKIQIVFQKILKAMMHPRYFKEIWRELQDLADKAEEMSAGEITEFTETKLGFGESLNLNHKIGK